MTDDLNTCKDNVRDSCSSTKDIIIATDGSGDLKTYTAGAGICISTNSGYETYHFMVPKFELKSFEYNGSWKKGRFEAKLGNSLNATNNRGEMLAIVIAIEIAKSMKAEHLTFITDSKYCLLAYDKYDMSGYPEASTINRDLIECLYRSKKAFESMGGSIEYIKVESKVAKTKKLLAAVSDEDRWKYEMNGMADKASAYNYVGESMDIIKI